MSHAFECTWRDVKPTGCMWNDRTREGKVSDTQEPFKVTKQCGGVLTCPTEGCEFTARPFVEKKPSQKYEKISDKAPYTEKA